MAFEFLQLLTIDSNLDGNDESDIEVGEMDEEEDEFEPRPSFSQPRPASTPAVKEWRRYICETVIENNPQELGGIDENGDPICVEIDESKFFHRKYHRGQWREGH
ncbi:hypothetical protein ElyMa_000066600 [Elysia marginata]|uniref:PiggyBac transposable element-derived protein domain-containing protein n=1 Tax=Elysia marginata TaxID=1093978 RepID=A0AAV4EGQ1_9GAST|nr:hypothetical protein ElyMa_000066600 [Elysia marginata]